MTCRTANAPTTAFIKQIYLASLLLPTRPQSIHMYVKPYMLHSSTAVALVGL